MQYQIFWYHVVPKSTMFLQLLGTVLSLEQILNAKPLSERGKKILAVAQMLFLEHGYDNTSLEMIISESGGSRRNIYSEFGNKEKLLLAVIREKAEVQVGTLLNIDYDLPPQQALSQVCYGFAQGFLSETMVKLFRLVTNIVPKLPEVGELIYHFGPLRGSIPLAKYLTHLHQQNMLDVDDAEYAAKLLIEMIKGRLHIKAVLLPNEPISDQEVQEHVDKAVARFLKAYKVV